MSSVSSPFGLRPMGTLGGEYTGGFRQYPILSSESTRICYGDIVKLTDGGSTTTIQKDTGTSACTPIGIFLGCRFIDVSTKQLTFSQQWSGAAHTEGMAYVADDPNILFAVQADGTVNDDDLGGKYEEGLKTENVKYFYSKKKEELPTGTCLILVTPDSERTMCTFLGTAGKINENDVDANAIKKSEIIFLEGYLWDEGDPKKAFDKAINNANKVAMSLSDQFCVDRHKPHFLELVKNKLDITFANEQEIMSLIETKSFEDVINFAKELKKLLVITRGEKGAVSINGNEMTECGIKKNLKIVDLTGAGDLFAAGFLHGYINKLSTKECLEKGTEMSSKVIQQIGARLKI